MRAEKRKADAGDELEEPLHKKVSVAEEFDSVEYLDECACGKFFSEMFFYHFALFFR